MQVMPYLFFDGRTEEALAFYKKAVGAEVTMLMRFKDNPDPPQPGSGCGPMGAPDKVMHCGFRIGNTEVMASDGNCTGKPSFQGFALSIDARDEAHARKLYDALGEGGQVQMPLGRTFFSPAFGMVTDRFGITWMVIVPQPMS